MSKSKTRPQTTDSLQRELRAKGRSRRAQLTEMALVSAGQHAARNDLFPALTLTERPVKDLVTPARNVRNLEPAHVLDIAKGISHFGWVAPILIDEAGSIIDGVIRVEAAKLLGLTSVPCLVANHLSDTDKRLLRIALDRLSEKGTWKLEALKAEFLELRVQEVSVELSGFSLPEIDQIVLGDDLSPVEDGSLEPQRDAVAVARLGDMFRLGDHMIACGDATDPDIWSRLMNDDRARLLLTDEPYNVPISGHVTKGDHREFPMASGELSAAEFLQFNVAWMQAGLGYLCDGGVFGTFIDWRGYPVVHAAITQLGLEPWNLVVWAKSNAGMGSNYRSQHELLPLFKKGSATPLNNIQLGKHGRWRSNVWTYPGASSLGSDARKGLQYHPTVKPVAMLQDALLDLTNKGDIVIDPFLGSGSTLLAAESVNRRCRGVELDPLYVDLVIQRFERTFGKSAVLLETGETYAQLAERRRHELKSVSAAE